MGATIGLNLGGWQTGGVDMTDTVTVRDVTVSHPDTKCDHKRHTKAFKDADCCYACYREGSE